MAVNAGIDMSMVPDDYTFNDILLDLVQSGEISEARIDLSVRRILTVKAKLGLLSPNPYPDPNNPNIATIGGDADKQVTLQAARESITLLQNTNGGKYYYLKILSRQSNTCILYIFVHYFVFLFCSPIPIPIILLLLYPISSSITSFNG